MLIILSYNFIIKKKRKKKQVNKEIDAVSLKGIAPSFINH